MPLATRGLYMEDGVNHVSGAVLPRTSSLVPEDVLSCSFQQSVWPALAIAHWSCRMGTWRILLLVGV